MTVTQGGTRTCNLGNGLLCSSQLSYSNSVAEFEYLRLDCQGYSRSRYQAGMFNGEGAANVKYETQAQSHTHTHTTYLPVICHSVCLGCCHLTQQPQPACEL